MFIRSTVLMSNFIQGPIFSSSTLKVSPEQSTNICELLGQKKWHFPQFLQWLHSTVQTVSSFPLSWQQDTYPWMSMTCWQNELNTHSFKAETLIPSHSNSLSIAVSSMSVHNALHRIDLNTVVRTYLWVTRSVCYRSWSQWKDLICLINGSQL